MLPSRPPLAPESISRGAAPFIPFHNDRKRTIVHSNHSAGPSPNSSPLQKKQDFRSSPQRAMSMNAQSGAGGKARVRILSLSSDGGISFDGDRMATPDAASTAPLPAPFPTQNHQSRSVPLEKGDVRVIGLGPRGIGAIGRLIDSRALQEADYWSLEADPQILGRASPLSARILLGGSLGTASERLQAAPTELFRPDDLERMLRAPDRVIASVPRSAHVLQATLPSRMNQFGGLAFVLGAGGSIPGGNDTFLSLVRQLRVSGRFVVACVTRPLAFEGKKRVEAANELIREVAPPPGRMSDNAADLTIVVDQQTLMESAPADLTVTEASAVADGALERAVRSIVDVLTCQEILKETRGSLFWARQGLGGQLEMGKPVATLLRSAGAGTLGRGLAMGPGPAALPALAAEAVRAGADSPFTRGVLPGAPAVLCCLTLPAREERAFVDGSLVVRPRAAAPSESDCRAAMQAASQSLRALCGPDTDVLVCSQPRPWFEEAGLNAGRGQESVEVTLLVISPQGVGQGAAGVTGPKITAGTARTVNALTGGLPVNLANVPAAAAAPAAAPPAPPVAAVPQAAPPAQAPAAASSMPPPPPQLPAASAQAPPPPPPQFQQRGSGLLSGPARAAAGPPSPLPPQRSVQLQPSQEDAKQAVRNSTYDIMLRRRPLPSASSPGSASQANAQGAMGAGSPPLSGAAGQASRQMQGGAPSQEARGVAAGAQPGSITWHDAIGVDEEGDPDLPPHAAEWRRRMTADADGEGEEEPKFRTAKDRARSMLMSERDRIRKAGEGSMS